MKVPSWIDQLLLAHGDELIHAALPYDPAQAHLYYLNNRKLKGKTPGEAKTKIGRAGARSLPISKARAKVVPISRPKVPRKKTAEQLKKERKAVEARVGALKTRLETLRKVLAQLTKQAKLRSGVTTPTASEKKASSEKSDLTTKQKSDAAKSSKDYYDKNKKKEIPDDAKALQVKIQDVQDKIKKMREELAAANKKPEKKNAGSVGVSNIRTNK
jgi:hypothetical protein